MVESFLCPRCNRRLPRSGEIRVDGQVAPLAGFQCDECLDEWKVDDGDPLECAFTFVVGPDGLARNPETGAVLQVEPR